MLRLILSRLLSLALTLLFVSLAIFLILEVLPGDPAAIMLGTAAREDTLAALRQELGLDQPALFRYVDWIGGLLHGDLGTSITYKMPVSTLVAERMGVTPIRRANSTRDMPLRDNHSASFMAQA
jgi:peptide/nickel transport system permease protein